MELPENCTVYLLTPPDRIFDAAVYGQNLGHMAYRVGGGPHLYRNPSPVRPHGGLMVLDHHGFDGQGRPDGLCREILRECAARGFSGVFFDFEGQPQPLLRKVLELLAPLAQKQGLTLYTTEPYALKAPNVKVVIPSALSGGSLRSRLLEAAERYGAAHLVLGLERTAEDFTLPAATGRGRAMTQEELAQLRRDRAPAVYFSNELCAHYFTYMRPGESAHFVLFDDAATFSKKLHTAAALGVRTAFLPFPGAEDLLPQLFQG